MVREAADNFIMKLKIKNIVSVVLIGWLIGSVNLSAQEFKASVDKTTVGQNEKFKVYFEFSGGDYNKVKNFRAPSFEGLKVLGGPNQSTSMQFINGKMSASVTYSYILASSKIGKFKIEPASIYFEDKVLSSKPITIEVTKAAGKISNGNTTGGISNEELAKNVFIRAIPSKTNVYQGEQVTVTYKLYTKLNISSPQINKLPANEGFWAEDLETSNNISFNIEMYNGERFRAAEIKRVALFPTKSGKLTVSPFELKVPVIIKKRRSSRDIFDDFFNDSFFGSETIEFVATSNTININVKALPKTNVPATFKGAVGEFDFSATLDKADVELNEAITFTVKVSGKGNIQLISVPEVDLPNGFEKYDPKSSKNISRKNIVSGNKTVEYLAIARIPGVKEIPPVEFSYFDPSRKRYVTKRSSPFTIDVKKGAGGFENNVSSFSKEDIKLLSEDIRFIKTSNFDLRKKGEFKVIASWFWIFTIAPLLILLVTLGVKKRQDKLTGNIQLSKYRKAEKAARGKLKIAKKAYDAGDKPKFYEETSKAVFGYLEDKLNIQKSEFTQERAISELLNQGIADELVSRVKSISEKCEFARFAPKAENSHAEKNMYDEALSVIIELENSLIGTKKVKSKK
ncbi:MAG: protein BatD [Ignavibacteriae bacterium]|nr:protein BatD [Ignavibacteriota bacterium]